MRLFTVDAFTDTPFCGNPAGVCILERALSNKDYLKIAQEVNLSETAFVVPKGETFLLRWFTPKNEVDLCGHATLATAKILFDKLQMPNKVLEFETKSGILKVEKKDTVLQMNFPLGQLKPLQESDVILEKFLNEKPLSINVDKDWCVLELADEDHVKNFKPDFSLLRSHHKKIVVITAKSKQEHHDFVSRVFGPAIGIDEDPVTGSAHCYLASFWAGKLNKSTLVGYQASKRGGVVHYEITDNQRVLLRGDCVIMSEMLIDWSF
ncbi:PhzF family phenazine biosynthesis protein [Pseudotamlana carrageenivorans]|uniref:PhzF family phenazine biosynthesis protein n=1 Tax=Pseudotamlana carrageenivorans TaxID=2069432 RepID=A0A2I7SIH9_9FLAO|nr:PhzF family phenazine biosynthesis isomerase [Tamlana carrageenivorans]AUS05713.1 PhzF family phenazine biosynthesis protein [Tamlana carrageenivorans]